MPGFDLTKEIKEGVQLPLPAYERGKSTFDCDIEPGTATTGPLHPTL